MRWRSFTPWAVGFLLLMLFLVIGAIDRTFFRGEPSQQPTSTTQQGQPPASRRQAPGTAAGSEHRDVLKLLDEAEANIDKALGQVDVWQTEIEPLQDNSAGHAVGKDPELADSMGYLLDQDRTPAERLRADRDRLGVLRKNVERLAAGTTLASVSPDERLEIEEIKEIHARASKAREEWQIAVRAAEAIVRKSQPIQPSDAPSEEGRPLRDSIENIQGDKALVDLKIQREKDAARKKLEEEATSPEVLRTLAPFVTPRFMQPKLSGAAVLFQKTYEKAPMSLSRLAGMQALEPTTHGLTMLARIGCDRDLTEPKWSIPTEPHARTEETQSLLTKAQGMLIQYGEVLVETGHLSP